MKVSKEFKIGLIVILSLAVLILGINYLKGRSFFGGDDIYYAYFPASGSLEPSSPLNLNGVEVGKVISVRLVSPNSYTDPNKRVLVEFAVQNKDLKIARGSRLRIIPGFLSTEVQLEQNFIAEEGYFEVGDTIDGTVSQEITAQIESQLLPVKVKMEDLMTSVENIVNSISVFWDTTAAYTLDKGLNEVKIAIARFGDLAYNLDDLVVTEKARIQNIVTNVEDITDNFKETNQEIKKIVNNMATISDTLLTVEFKETISEATVTLQKLNSLLSETSEGQGTLGKLLKDEQLYNELNQTNDKLQELIDDIKAHPDRYIHFSVFGAKTKGIPLSKEEEKKLKKMLDTIN